MSIDRIDHTGFAPHRCERAHGHRTTALAQLITSAALALSIAIAGTAVSIGIARADGIPSSTEVANAHVTVAALLSLVIVGVAGLAYRSRARAKSGE